MSRSTRIAAAALAACTILPLVGCNHGDSTIAEWRRNPTPILVNLHETDAQIKNRETLVNDTNFRALRSDFERFILLDRPSRLGPGITTTR